jgi:hypothetical protein
VATLSQPFSVTLVKQQRWEFNVAPLLARAVGARVVGPPAIRSSRSSHLGLIALGHRGKRR